MDGELELELGSWVGSWGAGIIKNVGSLSIP